MFNILVIIAAVILLSTSFSAYYVEPNTVTVSEYNYMKVHGRSRRSAS